MDPVSALTATISLVDAVLRTGKGLYARFSAYKNAKDEVFQEILRFQGAWLRISDELEILKCILHTLEAALVQHFKNQMEVLQSKIDVALSRLERAIGEKGLINRVSYALLLKDPLKTAINDLEQWTSRFYPSWFSAARALKSDLQQYLPEGLVSSSRSARSLQNLQRALFKARTTNVQSSTDTMFHSTVKLIRSRAILHSTAGVATEIVYGVEYKVVVDEVEGNIEDIGTLSVKLGAVEDSSFCGLLRCRKVFKEEKDTDLHQCYFIFEVPPRLSEPHSLRDLLVSCPLPSLDNRFHLARLLARSIMFVHNYDFVHKNIRPETSLVFQKESESFGVVCLVGFKEFRSASGPTKQEQREEWAKDLYRHPSRQGQRPAVRYAMQHDIYSLGVCLLEIGLWTSLILLDEVSDLASGPAKILQINEFLGSPDRTEAAYKIKDALYKLAEDMLPGRMGTRYTNVVLTCLTAWEDQSKDSWFGAKGDFRNSTEVSIRFSEMILLKLEEISV